MLLRNREFRPDWYETEAPEFLFHMLVERGVSLVDPENRMAGMLLLSKFDVDNIGIEALVFQAGFLTIVEEQRDEFDDFFRLDYPNLEKGAGLNRGLPQHPEKANMEYA